MGPENLVSFLLLCTLLQMISVDAQSDADCIEVLPSSGCLPLFADGASGLVNAGNVCAARVGETIEVEITVDSENCVLKETHICNVPGLPVDFEVGTKSYKYVLNIQEVYGFVCGDEFDVFGIAGHATLSCDGEIIEAPPAVSRRLGRQESKTSRMLSRSLQESSSPVADEICYAAYYELAMTCGCNDTGGECCDDLECGDCFGPAASYEDCVQALIDRQQPSQRRSLKLDGHSHKRRSLNEHVEIKISGSYNGQTGESCAKVEVSIKTSCIAGSTGIAKYSPEVHANDWGTSDAQEPEISQMRELKVGDKVQGLDHEKRPSLCTVEAIGTFGSGIFYGNYTGDHYVLHKDDEIVGRHGDVGIITFDDKYQVLTSCPAAEDETGTAFTAIDADFCTEGMSWQDYVILHSVLLGLVRHSGGYWFSGSSYSSLAAMANYAPTICRTMVSCAKDHTTCDSFEAACVDFVRNALTDEKKAETMLHFPDLGDPTKAGSVSACITANETVTAL